MELFEYQKKIVDKAINYFKSPERHSYENKFNLFLQMGLGKTIIALEIAKRLQGTTVLVICPKSLIEMWAYNIGKILKGYSRIDKPEDLWECTFPSFCVINYEYFRIHVDSTVHVDICIFDEAHKLKNIDTKLHKRISAKLYPYQVLCLTGTPITRDYMDLFGILTCTGSPRVGPYSAAQFRSRYIINGGNKRTQELMDYIEPFSVFGDINEYVDMPEADDVIIPVHLSLEQLAQLRIIYNSKDNALARITRAQTVTSGIEVPKLTPKQIACIQLIDDMIADNQKVVLFCKYDREYDFFMSHYAGVCVGINGKTKDRETPVYLFQNDPKFKVFIGNLQTAGTGITLTAASRCIFYSETFTWGDAEQSKYRIYRIGQKHNCIYYHLLAIDTIDELIYQSNINKTNLIEDFKQKYGGN